MTLACARPPFGPGSRRLLPISAGLAAAALLAGCGLGAALDRMDQEAYQRACDSYGFRRGTDAYSNCMMQQAAQRAEENQRAHDREALEKLKLNQ